MVRIEFGWRQLALLVALLVAAVLVYLLRNVVIMLGIALMLTAALHPLVALAERRQLSHTWAVALVMLGLVLLPLLVIAALSPLIIGEVQGLASSVPALQTQADAVVRHFGLAGRLNETITNANPEQRIGRLAVVSAQQTVSLLVQVVTVIVMTGYLLADGPRLKRVLHEFVPRLSERHIEPLLHGMERVVGGYIRGQVLTSGLFGGYAFALCLVLRVPSPLLLGLVAAIGDVIPLFGVPAAMLVAVLVAFTQSVWQALAVLVGYALYSQLENQFIAPRIYARTVNLSPLMVILATIAGGALDGIVGILVGIPVVGVLKVAFDYIVEERRHGQQGAMAQMGQEATDPVGESYTKEAGAPHLERTGDQSEGDVPAPSVSPFEPLPAAETLADTDTELLQATSARLLRLEEQVARLMEAIGTDHQGRDENRHRAVP
jgi:predicted PurR-regulated permease PerM